VAHTGIENAVVVGIPSVRCGAALGWAARLTRFPDTSKRRHRAHLQ